jgi:hypothetical protein
MSQALTTMTLRNATYSFLSFGGSYNYVTHNKICTAPKKYTNHYHTLHTKEKLGTSKFRTKLPKAKSVAVSPYQF